MKANNRHGELWSEKEDLWLIKEWSRLIKRSGRTHGAVKERLFVLKLRSGMYKDRLHQKVKAVFEDLAEYERAL